jgi:hypothetical protein
MISADVAESWALIGLLVSMVGTIAYEYCYFKFFQYCKNGPPVKWAICVVLTVTLFRFSSALLGATVVLKLWPAADYTITRVISLLVGVIGGVWLLAIALQVALNVVRRIIGAPLWPVIWFSWHADE